MKGTTNIELIEFAKCLSIPNFYCICKDEQNGLLKSPLNRDQRSSKHNCKS